MEIAFLQDFIVIFGLASLVNFLFQKINVPGIIGFLLTGIVLGPFGLGLIQGVHEIEIMAEIGVVLLLFSIGMEFSLKSLIQIQRTVFLGGSLQVVLTIGGTVLIARLLNVPWGSGIFYGFLVTLSSTAVVMKVIQERVEVNSHHGKTSLGILVFQDLVIVPMILFVPILAGESGNIAGSIGLMLLKTAGVILIVLLLARYAVPQVLHQVARTKSQELFLVVILLVGLTVAWGTSKLGLSLALGAFLAGLAISESEYSHQAFGRIEPFRDMFTSFFFVSIGMLLNLEYLSEHVLIILILSAGVILLKAIIAGFVAFVLGLPFQTTVVVGLMLSQLGEFSFLLSDLGLEKNLIPAEHYQTFLAVAIISMALAPFIIMFAPALSRLVTEKLRIPDRFVRGTHMPENPELSELVNHLVIVGMGLNGQNVARAAKIAGIPYLIIDSDPDKVMQRQKRGEPIMYGDANVEHILMEARIPSAEVVVLTISDPSSTFRITELVRKMNPKAHVIIRTRYLKDVEDLYELGADEVIPEEFETAVEIFARVLNKYLVPRDVIEQKIAELRADSYGVFRTESEVQSTNLASISHHLSNMEIASLHVLENSSIQGKSIAEVDLMQQYDTIILAINRDHQIIYHPRPDNVFLAEDIVIVMGEPHQVACVNKLFRESAPPSCE